jgi:hypothetical protein
MKKIIFVLFVLVFFIETPAQFRYGIEAGINLATIKGNYPQKLSSTTGVLIGINGSYNFFDDLSIESGLYLSQKGVTRVLFNDIQGIETYTYLEVPLNLKYNLPITESGKTFIFAGLYGAKLLSAGVRPDNEGQSSSVNLGDMIPSWDYGINVGLGQSFNISSGMMNIKVKYSLGLATLDKSYNVIKYGEQFSSYGSKKLNNSVFAITVGYTF